MQSTQRVKSYNGIIKNNVNGPSSLMELERTIERLLIKESRYVQLNENFLYPEKRIIMIITLKKLICYANTINASSS
jgi:hypothetical protein